MTRPLPAAARCSDAARHWFAYYYEPGTSAPACVRCLAPNPRYRPHDDPHRPS